MTPPAIVELLERHRVTVTGGVPTIWMGDAAAARPSTTCRALRMILCGGSAVPKALSEAYREAHRRPDAARLGHDRDQPDRHHVHAAQRTHDGAQPRTSAPTSGPGRARPCRWSTCGSSTRTPASRSRGTTSPPARSRPAGPWIAEEYYRGEGGGAQFTADGWLRTGDVASVDRYGFVRLVDRTKDLIKSGGEWIGSVELENEIMAHPKVAEAAVIAIPHEKWVERPLACVVVKPGETLTRRGGHRVSSTPRVAKWWLPDAVEFIDEVPKTSVGKFSKKTLREKFAGYRLPDPAGCRRLTIAELAERVLAGPPRCGATRLVCVDGPSGSGKTTLAGRLAAALGDPPVVHMDDLYPGWDGLAAAVPLLHEQVVAPLAAGGPARYRRYDWDRGEYAEDTRLGRPPVLVVEGVASGARPTRRARVLLVWVEAPRAERFRRGIDRDGETYRPHWERWARQEAAHFAADGTRARADLRVDGAPAIPHDPATEIVVAPRSTRGSAWCIIVIGPARRRRRG